MDIGFSRAIRFIGALNNVFTKSSASSCSFSLYLNHLAPLVAKCVQGGWAIIMSQFSVKWDRTSSCMCGPGRSDGNRSQDIASQPIAINASRTMPENSQAISIFIILSGRVIAPLPWASWSLRDLYAQATPGANILEVLATLVEFIALVASNLFAVVIFDLSCYVLSNC